MNRPVASPHRQWHRPVLLVLMLLSALGALAIGSAEVPVWQAWRYWLPEPEASDVLAWQILVDIRLPRVLLALVTGFALGMAGAAMQGLLRNPLAEPGILGVSSGAGLAAVLVLYFGLASWHSLALPAAAFVGSAVALGIVLLIAGARAGVTTLILAGVACSAFFSGLIALLLALAPNPFALQEMSYWLMGSVANRDLNQVGLMVPFVLLGAALLYRSGRYLQALTLGEDTAISLGFAPGRERGLLLIGTALVVGACVAMTGVIGFVGLLVPHVMRRLVHGDPHRLLLSSGLAGALLVLWMDTLAQALPTGPELRVGVMMTLLGGPFFLFLLLKRRGSDWGMPL